MRRLLSGAWRGIPPLGAVNMFGTLLLCVLTGGLLSLPIIRATRRHEAARAVIRRGDYLRTRRASRLTRVTSSTFAVRL